MRTLFILIQLLRLLIDASRAHRRRQQHSILPSRAHHVSHVRRATYASTTDSSTAALARARFASSSLCSNASNVPAIARTSSRARALTRAARSHSMRSASACAAHERVLASVADSDAASAPCARSRLVANACENDSSVRSSALRTVGSDGAVAGAPTRAPSPSATAVDARMRAANGARMMMLETPNFFKLRVQGLVDQC